MRATRLAKLGAVAAVAALAVTGWLAQPPGTARLARQLGQRLKPGPRTLLLVLGVERILTLETSGSSHPLVSGCGRALARREALRRAEPPLDQRRARPTVIHLGRPGR